MKSGITTKPVFATVSSPLYEKRGKPTTRSTATTPACSANIPSLILPPSSLKRMTTAAFIRMVASVNGQQIAVYTAHLDYLSDAYYNVRGYDGSTWKEIPIPETVQEILAINDASQRDDAIREFVKAAKKDIAEGRMVILGGDFNEPSHLDWTRKTKDLYDHNGLIVPWTVPLILDNNGFVDAYRTLYPNVLDYPGFTFPSDNEKVPTQKLTWAPKSDERDRIDYIFYYPHPQLELKNAAIFGPQGSIVKNQRKKETSKDPFIEPLDTWPTDHKGVFVTFLLKR